MPALAAVPMPAFLEMRTGWLMGTATAVFATPLVFTGWFRAAGSSPALTAGDTG